MKNWWESRTIWLNVVAVIYATAAGFNLLPAGITQEEVLSVVMGVVGMVGLGLRLVTSKHIV